MTSPDLRSTGTEPIRQATNVRSDRDHTFDVFTRRFGEWWPYWSHSQGQERVAEVRFERDHGGRVYEVWDDGTERDWGRVITWEPTTRFTITWELMSEVTEVEVRFVDLGPSLTRVELEHRGWERLSATTEVPRDYNRGWKMILGRFAEATES